METHVKPAGLYEDIPDDLISVPEAAKRIGFTTVTVYTWIDKGKIPGYIHGFSNIYVSAADIEALRLRRIVPKGGES